MKRAHVCEDTNNKNNMKNLVFVAVGIGTRTRGKVIFFLSPIICIDKDTACFLQNPSNLLLFIACYGFCESVYRQETVPALFGNICNFERARV